MKKLEVNKVYIGDCLDVLTTFPDESIDMCITSPPYWGLRDYGVDNQLGLEETPEEFVDKLCDVFDEVKRVLKPHGSCWVNLGDSYCRSPNSQDKSGKTGITTHKYDYDFKHKKNYGDTYKPKSLVQIPSRFAIEMTNRGWILRNEIIWHKPSCLPASVKDRYTVDFEKMFFFTKKKKYYFKQQIEEVNDSSKRNKRTVWSVSTAKFEGAHFAVYPPEIIESPIDAGCPEEICTECGKGRVKIMESPPNPKGISGRAGKPMVSKDGVVDTSNGTKRIETGHNSSVYTNSKFVGYDECDCNAGFTGGTVLDPFFGSGTTAEVAMKQDKNWVGIELNDDYIKISDKRLKPTIVEKKTREKASEFWG